MTNIREIIASFSQEELLLVHQGTGADVSELLASKGFNVNELSRADSLRLIRESMTELSDDDLQAVSGGEIGKVLAITVATATASVVAGVVAGTAIGVNQATH
jgi:bacteriocin-like protein